MVFVTVDGAMDVFVNAWCDESRVDAGLSAGASDVSLDFAKICRTTKMYA